MTPVYKFQPTVINVKLLIYSTSWSRYWMEVTLSVQTHGKLQLRRSSGWILNRLSPYRAHWNKSPALPPTRPQYRFLQLHTAERKHLSDSGWGYRGLSWPGLAPLVFWSFQTDFHRKIAYLSEETTFFLDRFFNLILIVFIQSNSQNLSKPSPLVHRTWVDWFGCPRHQDRTLIRILRLLKLRSRTNPPNLCEETDWTPTRKSMIPKLPTRRWGLKTDFIILVRHTVELQTANNRSIAACLTKTWRRWKRSELPNTINIFSKPLMSRVLIEARNERSCRG